jgi:hypothetical protein
MEELSDEAKRMLDAFKAAETPPRGASDRMWTAIAAGGAGLGLSAMLAKGKLIALGGIVLGGLVGIVLLVPPHDEVPTVSGRAAPEVAAPDAVERPEAPLPTPGPPVVPPAATTAPATPPGPADRSRRGATRTEAPAEEAAPAGDLERELTLLGRAKTELAAGRPARARELLAEHAQAFPRSSFAEERELLSITALCDLGRAREARAGVEGFKRRHPGSALSERVEAICAAP